MAYARLTLRHEASSLQYSLMRRVICLDSMANRLLRTYTHVNGPGPRQEEKADGLQA